MKRAWLLLGLAACPPPLSADDIAPPTVVSVVPADQSIDVAPGTVIQACFDSPLRPTTVTATAVALSREDGHEAQAIAIDVGLDASGTCLGITPTSPLSPSSHYQLTLKNTLLGANGVALESSKSADAYTASFATLGPPATAVMLIPADGMLGAPLDLAQVILAFSAPVTLSGALAPFSLLPGGGPSTLSADGRLATGPFDGASAGAQVQVTLAPGLSDPSGQTPDTRGPLGFTLGDCSEGTAPNVATGLAVSRDVDAWLQFTVDRPGLCGALLADPGSPDAGVLRATAATCTGAYTACLQSSLCLCNVPLAGLGPGDTIQATPTLLGYDGLVGDGPLSSFQTAAALPGIVVSEIFPGEAAVGFVELQNRSGAPIDLTGVALVDCGLSLGCASPKGSAVTFAPPGGVGSSTLAADGYALLAGPTFDSSVAPPDTLVLAPIEGDSMLHLSTTGYQSLGVFLPGAQVPVSTYDGSLLPQTGFSLERVDPGATDATPGDWAISTVLGGTPGACNSVTPGDDCDP